MLIAGFPTGAFQANCYVLATEPGGPCLAVDPGQDAAEPLAALLAEHRLTPSAVLLTHGHLDHVAGAAQVCGRAGIPAHIAAADEHLLDDPLAGLSAELRSALVGFPLDGLRPPEVVLLADRLESAGIRLHVDRTPGHTPGSVVFRIEADEAARHPEVLFTGDILFAGSVGRTDLPGGSWEELQHSLRASLLTRTDDAVVLPGHGPSSTIGAERVGNPFLTDGAGLGE
ncbi:MAG: MBL fold metallo-hydrolase [Williamsia herbipolensis]|nr:MBL fold metallo-hydrolase [Williamsia herbipolensis]